MDVRQAIPIDAAQHYTEQARLALFDEMREALHALVVSQRSFMLVKQPEFVAALDLARALLARVDQL